MSGRLLSLAAGTVLDVDPASAVDVAADAGFGGVGIWFDPATWGPAVADAVRRRLDARGIVALDIEPVILGRDGGDHGEAIVDAAVDVGARHVLLASGSADVATVADRFGALCDRAAPGGVVVVLEFLPIFSVATLAAAVAAVAAADRPNGGVLVDTLHLARSGATPDDLAAVVAAAGPARFPYLQLADAPATAPDTSWNGLRDEALNGRLLPGDGELPLAAVLAALPDVPISVELRSADLVASHPDPVARALAVRTASDRVLVG